MFSDPTSAAASPRPMTTSGSTKCVNTFHSHHVAAASVPGMVAGGVAIRYPHDHLQSPLRLKENLRPLDFEPPRDQGNQTASWRSRKIADARNNRASRRNFGGLIAG